MKDLAANYRVHRSTVLEHLRRRGLRLRTARALTDAQVDEVIQRYRGGESCAAIAMDYDCNPETIRNWLKRRGVELRSRRGWEYG